MFNFLNFNIYFNFAPHMCLKWNTSSRSTQCFCIMDKKKSCIIFSNMYLKGVCHDSFLNVCQEYPAAGHD